MLQNWFTLKETIEKILQVNQFPEVSSEQFTDIKEWVEFVIKNNELTG